VVWSGFELPTAVRFAPNGNVFVAEKSGIIKMFDSIDDPTPTVFADLRTEVNEYWDRGLVGLAIDPDYPAKPYIYAFYAVDAPPGQTPPVYQDLCPGGNCPANSRVVKIVANGNVMASKTTLREAWCHDNYSHSAADLFFDSSRALYVSHGDGASFNYVDFDPSPNNCGDPPLEGGAIRSQDLRTFGDPVSYDGALIRIDPDTGAAAPGNPLLGGDPADDAVIAYGFRNPFRISRDSASGRLWIGDVGWDATEEVDTIADPLVAPIKNFGWPCYEGQIRQPGYDAADIPVCEDLYATGAVEYPVYDYGHTATGGAISGIALYRGANFPQKYQGALFFADYTRGWIRAMLPGSNGLPDPTQIETLVEPDATAVDLQVSNEGYLFYADIYSGTVHRVKYVAQNTAPTAVAAANRTFGALPLSVTFDASGSTDPDVGDTLSYAWDLDGDGQFDDSTAVAPTFVYNSTGVVTARLRVTDAAGGFSIANIVIDAGNTPPQATILTPSSSMTFAVGDVITFSGQATDAEDGSLPASALNWRVVLHHCAVLNPSNCHEHFLQDIPGVASGSFIAPDHEFPMYIELRLTVQSGTLTDVKSVNLQPRTTTWTFDTVPTGLNAGVYAQALPTPYSRAIIVGGQTSIAVDSPQTLDGVQYQFSSWSDGGARSHSVTADANPRTYTATFAVAPTACTLTATPASVVVGSSSTLSWTTTNATSLSIDQGIGTVTPIASGTRSVTPASTTTYTATATSATGTATCTATVTTMAAPAETVWRSFDATIQSGTPQGTLTSVTGNKVVQLEFYESTNTGGIAKGAVFGSFTTGAHAEGFNKVERFWSAAGAGSYPYAGKSMVNRGADAGETNTPAPVGVRDMQLHPPGNLHLTVAAFRVPEDGNYSVTDLGVRRVDGNAGFTVRFRVFNPTGTQVTTLRAASPAWVTSTATFNLGTLTAGQYIYFAVDPDGDYTYDATEITWQVRETSIGPPPAPTCTVTGTPASISLGTSAALSWITSDATTLSIDQGIGAVTPVASGSTTVSPTTTTTYTGTVNGPGGTGTCSATITVTPAVPPTCSLSATPASIVTGASSTLSWTTSGTTAFSIDQGVGAVTPVATGTRSVTPLASLTYTGTATGPGGTASCAATVTVSAAPAETVWRSFDTVVQGTAPQGSLTSTDGSRIAQLELYESTNNGGVTKGALFGSFITGTHGDAFNKVDHFWSAGGTSPYPYAGKSTVNRGSDTGESNTPSPTGVRDLQLHPPGNQHLTVAAFKVPDNADYTVTDLAVRRVDGNAGYSVRLRLFNAQGTQLANLQSTSQAWTRSTSTYNLGTLTSGQYIYFAVDADDNFYYDATEIAWLVHATGTAPPPPPTCTLSVSPSTIVSGGSSTLSWVTTDATSLTIDQSIGGVTPVANGSRSINPLTNTTYTGTVTGPSGTATCSTTIVVTPPPAPTCAISGTPASISDGNSAALSWTTTNATSLSIDQSVGTVTPVASGSTNVSPTTTTTYTGTVTGPGGTATCSATITVTPAVPPTCTLNANPTSIVAGASSTLSWTTTSATAFSINQGIGAVTPVTSGTRSITPAATLTYTGTATGPAGTANCSATVAVSAAPAETVWQSFDTVVQGTLPQGSLTSVAGSKIAQLEFYESTNNGGVTKGALFGSFTTGTHGDAFNKVDRIWSAGGSSPYPYAGKSTINRGSDTGESNTPAPTGVRDLQLHPPGNQHLTVAAFKIPEDGTYSVTDLALRRVDGNTGFSVRLKLFNAQGTQLANLQATSQAWVRSTSTFNVGALTAGQYIYFAVDADDGYFYDATEIAWTVHATGTAPPPTPTCALNGVPASISLGNSAALSWTTTNATSLSIDNAVGSVTPVPSGSTNVSPTATTTYTGSVTGPGGTANCSTTITVTPAVAPTCSLAVTPASIVAGASTTLSWTTTSATALSIDQGVGAVTPVASGSRSVTPAATLTYTGTVTGPAGTANCSAIATVSAAPAETVWRSYDAVVQGTSPQGTLTSVAGSKIAQLEFYESTNNGGIAKGLLFGSFTTAPHTDSFNKVETFWSSSGASSYPYAGKSTVVRGSDAGETNTPAPTGVRDLQLHPPSNLHLTVAAFKVPESGTYSVTDLAIRRVDANANLKVRVRLFNAQGTQLATLEATSRAWVLSPSTYTLGALTAGQYIYFALDADGDGYFYDAAEIAWQVKEVQ